MITRNDNTGWKKGELIVRQMKVVGVGEGSQEIGVRSKEGKAPLRCALRSGLRQRGRNFQDAFFGTDESVPFLANDGFYSCHETLLRDLGGRSITVAARNSKHKIQNLKNRKAHPSTGSGRCGTECVPWLLEQNIPPCAVLRGKASNLADELIVFRVATDPEPQHAIRRIDGNGAVVKSNAHGSIAANFFEMERRVAGISF
ncbi:MAG: hypothetical protein A3F68_13535 [Acidobacteria bacterium RIFCSPLOWO2_12_FULL_54_10]|nr:MAG: hypothetical protein A3F68_13535 [Acidobacteria bacterium RIFCSPLOWO2_12_FULL_54_10]